MIIFEAMSIYGVDTERSFYLRGGDVVPDSDETILDIRDAMRPIHVSGLNKGDFSVFVSVADTEEADEIPYLVTHHGGDTSVIVPERIISANINSYATPELARLLRAIPEGEVAQFGIAALMKQLERRFPGG